MAAVAALIVAVLSITQICRALRSVDLLQEGARRIGEKDFTVRVDVDGTDEFGQLGASFNTMAARLGGEFNAMLTLSDIDQAIVSRLDLDRVIETVLARMRDVVPADFVSIAIADRNAPAMVRIYTRDQREGGGLELERCAFSAADTDVLLAYPDGLWLDRAQAVTPYLAPVAKLGAASLLVLPDRVAERRRGHRGPRFPSRGAADATRNGDARATSAIASAWRSRPPPRTSSSTFARTTTR